MFLRTIIIINAIITNYLCVTNASFQTKHEHIVEQFRRSAEGIDRSGLKVKWIKQPLDHFNKSETREWNMKYFENLTNFVSGGPLYIYINGEGVATSDGLVVGTMAELAKDTRGAMWGTEHRYYGESQPFPESTTPNFRYLSSRQALADIANFIKQKKQIPEFSSSKVVVIGGSYAGNLAAWMKLLYPELVDAALASSAPVLAKTNFYEYLETVGDVFKKYTKPDCFEKINAYMDRLKNLLKTEAGIRQVKKEFNICPCVDMTNPNNQEQLFQIITKVYTHAAQYEHPEEINMFCDGKMVYYAQNSLNFAADYCCNNINYRLTECDAWFYQVCTEFGYFVTSPENEPFANLSITLELYYKRCSYCFGPEINEKTIEASVNRTNEIYGGLKPNLTNVIFSNGEIDPWHRLSILEDLSETVPSFMIPKASHCADLLPSKNEETKLVKLKEKILIKKWIGM